MQIKLYTLKMFALKHQQSFYNDEIKNKSQKLNIKYAKRKPRGKKKGS